MNWANSLLSSALWVSLGLIIVVTPSLVACNQHKSDELKSGKASELNDSAMILFQERAFGRATHSYRDVLDLLDRAIAYDSTYRVAYMNKSSVFQNIGNYDEASAVVREWLNMHPADAQARIMLAILYGLDGEPVLADLHLRQVLSDYNTALTSHSDSLELLSDRAFVLILLGQRDQARADMDSLLDAYPKSERLRLMRNIIAQSDSEAVAQSYFAN